MQSCVILQSCASRGQEQETGAALLVTDGMEFGVSSAFRAIDEQSVRRFTCLRQLTENVFLDATLGPVDEPILKSLLGSIDIGAVGPTSAATPGIDDPAQHTTITPNR
ncbi:hypothetical protein SAMN03080618_03315 [Aquamicrobium aerolatum DSM 21857]|uniref:Uncharacterized protein n=1 Tax=Aquamicrobium aerolatum DSM 21857 TaxID=1121003 RepID=A0A1I3SBH9_9HYPH|nr:hypothetical protein SAMN03080618_03315 [Aquamicrobium aerolatum DSM 21857]